MLSMSEELLLKEKDDIFAGRDDLAEGGLGAGHAEVKLRPLAVTRFHLAPYGYRVDIDFSPADMNF